MAIWNMIEKEDKVTIPKLISKTGLPRGFFYKNLEVRQKIDKAMQQQAGMVDKRKRFLIWQWITESYNWSKQWQNCKDRTGSYRNRTKQ